MASITAHGKLQQDRIGLMSEQHNEGGKNVFLETERLRKGLPFLFLQTKELKKAKPNFEVFFSLFFSDTETTAIGLG